MPRGDKSSYTDKQKREAEHIEKDYEQRGVSEKESERRAWATVNKQDGGGNKSGSGKAGGAKKKSSAKKSSHKKTGAKKSATKKSSAAKKSPARKSARKSSRSKQR
ncbi:MAG: hypothetical protein ACREP1_05925 [Rhodanobacteraceae bacterium]